MSTGVSRRTVRRLMQVLSALRAGTEPPRSRAGDQDLLTLVLRHRLLSVVAVETARLTRDDEGTDLGRYDRLTPGGDIALDGARLVRDHPLLAADLRELDTSLEQT